MPAGHWQVEVDAADWTHQRRDGTTLDYGVFASAEVKYGVTGRLDLELTLPAYTVLQGTGMDRTSGASDMVARAKIGLVGGADAVALVPYLKLPTAGAGLGNGAVEGGLVAPINLTLPAGLSLSLDPELDLLKNNNDGGTHLAYALAVGVSRALTPTLTGAAEVWSAESAEPGVVLRQASFDLGLAWIPKAQPALQLDGGVNLGLNRETPDMQVYVGVSRRF